MKFGWSRFLKCGSLGRVSGSNRLQTSDALYVSFEKQAEEPGSNTKEVGKIIGVQNRTCPLVVQMEDSCSGSDLPQSNS